MFTFSNIYFFKLYSTQLLNRETLSFANKCLKTENVLLSMWKRTSIFCWSVCWTLRNLRSLPNKLQTWATPTQRAPPQARRANPECLLCIQVFKSFLVFFTPLSLFQAGSHFLRPSPSCVHLSSSRSKRERAKKGEEEEQLEEDQTFSTHQLDWAWTLKTAQVLHLVV